MIISPIKLKEKHPNESIESLTEKIIAIESAIRNYTKNNFQDRRVRFNVEIKGNICTPWNPLIKEGDTVTLSQGINEGFYNVESSTPEGIKLSGDIVDTTSNLLTKVLYPADVMSVAMDLVKWTVEYSDKQAMGISSESISRYSVSYGNMNSEGANINGYPVSIMSRLNPYMRAKF